MRLSQDEPHQPVHGRLWANSSGRHTCQGLSGGEGGCAGAKTTSVPSTRPASSRSPHTCSGAPMSDSTQGREHPVTNTYTSCGTLAGLRRAQDLCISLDPCLSSVGNDASLS